MTFPAANLDSLLLDLMRANREKVAAWLRDEPGQLGLSGWPSGHHCPPGNRPPLDRDPERRQVWHRLWQLLSRLRAQMDG